MNEKKKTARRREYWVWADMKGRCQNPKHAAFPNYGGRGIVVCDRWQRYDAFASDMLPRPEGGMLDRVDNNGPYSPENCRRVGLRYRPIVKRIQDRNWPIEQALAIPLGTGKHYRRYLERVDA